MAMLGRSLTEEERGRVEKVLEDAEAQIRAAFAAAGRPLEESADYRREKKIDGVDFKMQIIHYGRGEVKVELNLGRTTYRKWPTDVAKLVADVLHYVDGRKREKARWEETRRAVAAVQEVADRLNAEVGIEERGLYAHDLRVGAKVRGEHPPRLGVEIRVDATEEQARRLLGLCKEMGLVPKKER